MVAETVLEIGTQEYDLAGVELEEKLAEVAPDIKWVVANSFVILTEYEWDTAPEDMRDRFVIRGQRRYADGKATAFCSWPTEVAMETVDMIVSMIREAIDAEYDVQHGLS